jgi:hypothetical protein
MLKKYSKILAAVATVLLLVTMMAGCTGGGTLRKPEMKEGAVAVEVTGSCDIQINGDTITVSGETNLLPGSIIYISVEAQNGMTLDSAKITKGNDNKISQDFKITDEKYTDSVSSVTGHITCAPRLYGTQPTNIYETYGDKFENIKSEGLLWNASGSFVIFASESVDLDK